ADTAYTQSSVSFASGAVDDIAQSLGVGTGSVSIAGELTQDGRGNWYATVTITPSTATEVENLNTRGITSGAEGDALTSGTAATFYVAVDPTSTDSAGATA